MVVIQNYQLHPPVFSSTRDLLRFISLKTHSSEWCLLNVLVDFSSLWRTCIKKIKGISALDTIDM